MGCIFTGGRSRYDRFDFIGAIFIYVDENRYFHLSLQLIDWIRGTNFRHLVYTTQNYSFNTVNYVISGSVAVRLGTNSYHCCDYLMTRIRDGSQCLFRQRRRYFFIGLRHVSDDSEGCNWIMRLKFWYFVRDSRTKVEFVDRLNQTIRRSWGRKELTLSDVLVVCTWPNQQKFLWLTFATPL